MRELSITETALVAGGIPDVDFIIPDVDFIIPDVDFVIPDVDF